MLKKLVAFLFGKTESSEQEKAAPQPLHQVSDREKERTNDDSSLTSTTLQNNEDAATKVLDEAKLAAHSMERSEWLFYDFLLGPSSSTDTISELEKNILIRVNTVLANPNEALKAFPNLPDTIIKLMDMLKSDHFDLDAFCVVLEKDPAIASRLVTIANSAKYKAPSSKEITDIRQAFMAIGSQGVRQHVLQGFVRNLTRLSPIYFKVFGERIWQHSDDTAHICRYLATQRGLDQETAFLIGLVHDLGKILVFKLMVDAFKATHPDEQLESLVMKKLLQDKSMALSYAIAQKWSLPKVVRDAINDLAKQGKQSASTEMGRLLIEANFISECSLAREYELYTSAEFDAAIAKINPRTDILQYLASRWQQSSHVA